MTSRTNARSGFTLIEMAVVLAVMGLLLGLALTQARPRLSARQPHSAALEVAAALREARARAIGGGHNVAFRLDLDARRYQFDDLPPHALPSGLSLALQGAARLQNEEENSGSLVFAADGSASGGRITLATEGRRSTVVVNWLNGLVTVTDAQ